MQQQIIFEKEKLEPQEAIKINIFVVQSLHEFGSFKSISTGKMWITKNVCVP